MSSDDVMVGDDGKRYSYDNLKTQGWLEGHTSGAEAATEMLMSMAAAAFRANDDRTAKLFRDTANQIKSTLIPQMKERAAAHERDHPVVIGDDDD